MEKKAEKSGWRGARGMSLVEVSVALGVAGLVLTGALGLLGTMVGGLGAGFEGERLRRLMGTLDAGLRDAGAEVVEGWLGAGEALYLYEYIRPEGGERWAALRPASDAARIMGELGVIDGSCYRCELVADETVGGGLEGAGILAVRVELRRSEGPGAGGELGRVARERRVILAR